VFLVNWMIGLAVIALTVGLWVWNIQTRWDALERHMGRDL
jgi:hypothetical protein